MQLVGFQHSVELLHLPVEMLVEGLELDVRAIFISRLELGDERFVLLVELVHEDVVGDVVDEIEVDFVAASSHSSPLSADTAASRSASWLSNTSDGLSAEVAAYASFSVSCNP